MNVSDSKLYVSPMVANDLGLEFGDKKNRNANWTDHEVISFLEVLQEDEVLKDLSANRNKQVGLDSVIDFLIDGQIYSFCPDQDEGKLLTLIMMHYWQEVLKVISNYL